MTSDNICDILVPEKKQQSLRTQKNRLITSEYGLANAASLIRLAAFCIFHSWREKCRGSFCYGKFLRSVTKNAQLVMIETSYILKGKNRRIAALKLEVIAETIKVDISGALGKLLEQSSL